MSTLSRHALIQPSVLDRLLDDEPDRSRQPEAMLYELAQFKRSLARDLEALLNTRTMPLEDLFDAYPLASSSMLSGVSWAGLTIMVQPAASAGPILRVPMANGKFQGVIA